MCVPCTAGAPASFQAFKAGASSRPMADARFENKDAEEWKRRGEVKKDSYLFSGPFSHDAGLQKTS